MKRRLTQLLLVVLALSTILATPATVHAGWCDWIDVCKWDDACVFAMEWTQLWCENMLIVEWSTGNCCPLP